MTGVITRFAPSPTGFLHIGGARTALFNWLFSRHHKGRFLLRIEDTDRQRSTQEAVDAIIEGMAWMELQHDGEIIFQSQRFDLHRQAAYDLVKAGKAYEDKDPEKGTAIRLKAQKEGETIIEDQILGTIHFDNAQMDDMVLLRGDGTPTYMLSVVVDDHDMAITHIIRGDDHLTNAFRQTQLYKALGWPVPVFAHLPLIHGADGTKLSKRHGAVSTLAYRDMGILPEALRNYLLRLGWARGDEEIISTEDAIRWFDLDGVGKSPSRFDMAKLLFVNAHYLRQKSFEDLAPMLEIDDPIHRQRLKIALPELLERAKSLVELKEVAAPLIQEPETWIKSVPPIEFKADLHKLLKETEPFTHDVLFNAAKDLAATKGKKVGEVAKHLRLGLSGQTQGISVFMLAEALGREESLKRLDSVPAA